VINDFPRGIRISGSPIGRERALGLRKKQTETDFKNMLQNKVNVKGRNRLTLLHG
jgi:hypothetical protein